jgi:AcrR family transcriptional regulator
MELKSSGFVLSQPCLQVDLTMRYSATHKANTRKHLLQTAGALAKEKGFSTTGVDELMSAPELTSGAFYNHFSLKNELFSELLKHEVQHSFFHVPLRFLSAQMHSAKRYAVRPIDDVNSFGAERLITGCQIP